MKTLRLINKDNFSMKLLRRFLEFPFSQLYFLKFGPKGHIFFFSIKSAFWPNVVTELSCITFWIIQALEDK